MVNILPFMTKEILQIHLRLGTLRWGYSIASCPGELNLMAEFLKWKIFSGWVKKKYLTVY